MRNKIVAALGIAAIVGVALLPALAGAQMTTSTLATNIDSVSNTALGYVTVLLTTYWPFVLGFLILLGVIAFGKRAIVSLFH